MHGTGRRRLVPQPLQLLLVLVATAALLADARLTPRHGGGSKHDEHDQADSALELDCDALTKIDDSPAYHQLRIGSVFIVLVTSALGALTPILTQRFNASNKPWIRMLIDLGKFFGAGVILSTGLIHMFPGAVDSLGDRCAPEVFSSTYTAFPSLIAMFAMLAMHLIEYVLSSVAMKHSMVHHGHNHSHGIAHGPASPPPPPPAVIVMPPPSPPTLLAQVPHDSAESTLSMSHGMHDDPNVASLATIRARITTYVLELGIALHSVIIGVTLGVTGADEFKTLLVAIVFHQGFEGFALGARIADIFLSPIMPLISALSNAVFFILTTPVGIAIGIGISSSYRPKSAASLVVQGVFDAISTGILIYTALVSLMAEEFATQEFASKSRIAKIMCFMALYLGAAAMAIIGIWA
ncbi:ZIP zinc/iron transport family [Ramicandelaber brevisporus]|nr:ZIP zinc/iron transport family [Ramicandelaber brevisporus]